MFMFKVMAIIFFGAEVVGMELSELHKPQLRQPKDFSQNVLIEKMFEYLASNPETVDGQKNLDKNGMCNGLSTLWTYGMYLSDQALKNDDPQDIALIHNNKMTSKTTRDDHDFFIKAQDLLITKAFAEFSKEDHLCVDRFIQQLIFFQSWAFISLNGSQDQLDLEHTLEDTNKRRAQRLLALNLICTEGMLKKRLERLISIPGNMLFIGVKGKESSHQTAIYKKKNNDIFFYDPNSNIGKIKVPTADELLKTVWEATSINQKHAMQGLRVEDMFCRNLVIHAYNFGDTCNFGNMSLNEVEKAEMQGYKFLSSKFREALDALPTIPASAQEYKLIFEKKYAPMDAQKQAAAIHSELIVTPNRQKGEKIKGVILSGLPIRIDDIFCNLTSHHVISEEDKIEIIRLVIEHKLAKLMAKNKNCTIKTYMESPFNDQAAINLENNKTYAEYIKKYCKTATQKEKVAIRNERGSIFDDTLFTALELGQKKLIEFLLTAGIPEDLRPSVEGVGKAIYRYVCLTSHTLSAESLAIVKYLVGQNIPEQSKPEPFWVKKSQAECEMKAKDQWTKKVLNLTAQDTDSFQRLADILK